MIKNSIANDLLYSRKKICYFGIGYIGYSSAMAFASKGVKILAYDTDKTRCDIFKTGHTTVPNLREWLGFDPTLFAKHGLLDTTNDWRDLIVPENQVFIIAVPTEKDGLPFDGYLKSTMDVIANAKADHPIIIVESTISANLLPDPIYSILNKSLGKGNFTVVCAPRRDWFDSDSSHTLANMTRIVGTDNETTREEVENIIKIQSPTIYRMDSCKEACMVKSVENAIRFVEIMTAIEISNALSTDKTISTEKILKAAGTKWNIPSGLHGSISVGGYCLNVAPSYIQLSAANPSDLKIFSAAIETNDNQPARVAKIIRDRGIKTVLILGLSYKADVPVWIESPAIKLSKALTHMDIPTRVHDPYFSAETIEENCGIPGIDGDFLEHIPNYDAIVLISGHREYTSVQKVKLLVAMKNTQLIIDNDGSWDWIDFGHIPYFRVGSPGWGAAKE